MSFNSFLKAPCVRDTLDRLRTALEIGLGPAVSVSGAILREVLAICMTVCRSGVSERRYARLAISSCLSFLGTGSRLLYLINGIFAQCPMNFMEIERLLKGEKLVPSDN